jgi:uncharacterized caspase-like protein
MQSFATLREDFLAPPGVSSDVATSPFFYGATLMHRLLTTLALALLAVASLPPAVATASEMRFALVIGNASYKSNALATPANDAALIAQTLQAAGFEVTGARDLNGDGLRQALSDFADSLRKAGPDAVAVVYFAGCALQFEGENYLVPVDTDMVAPGDLPLRTVRLSDQMRSLAALHLKASIVIIDAARANASLLSDRQPASGLAFVEPETNMLIAFNAAPGTVSHDLGNSYGVYAKALAEMIREGGQPPASLFDRVRLRVHDLTKGAQVPWFASNINARFLFLDRDPTAPPSPDAPERIASMRSQPMRNLGARDAYFIALMRDTFDGYADFIADYWQDAMTKRVQALLAARREAIAWRRSYQANVPNAYWSYLERYPRGPHAVDARSLLTRFGAPTAVPSKFSRMEYDVPPPLPDELPYLERSTLALDDPELAFEPPPALPAHFLGPLAPELSKISKPAPPSEAHALPAIKLPPLPTYVSVPADVMALSQSVASSNVQDIPAIRGTIDSPTGQQSKVTISPTSQQSERSDPRELATTQSAVVVPAFTEAIDAPVSSEAYTATKKLIDPATVTSSAVETPTLIDEPTVYKPLIAVAPGPARLPQRQGNTQRKPGAIPLPISRPGTITPLGGVPARSSRAVVRPQTTASIPAPNSTSAIPKSPANSSVSKPTPHVALTPTSKPSDQVRKPPPSPLGRPAGSPPRRPSAPLNLVGASTVKPAESQQEPRARPCVVVEEKQVCN